MQILKRLLFVALAVIFLIIGIILCVPAFILFGADNCEKFANKLVDFLENLLD